MHDHSSFKVINGVRFDKDEVVSYYHYYWKGEEKPTHRYDREESYVELRFKGGSSAEIKHRGETFPTDLHSQDVLERLDRMFKPGC
jgi:hypothetical protein